MSDLVYLYGVVPRGSPAARLLAERAVAGIDGAAVRAVEEGDLAGAVSAVPAAHFDEAPLNRLVRDLSWLAPRAAAHQDVNAHLFAAGDAVLPVAFGAIFRDAAAVRRLLADRQQDLVARLGRLRDRAEWIVTVQRDEAQAAAAVDRENAAVRRLLEELDASSAGRAYLLRRRVDEERRRALLRLDAEVVQAVVARLAAHAEDLYREPLVRVGERPPALLDQADAAARAGPIARLSVLVRRDASAALLAATDQLSGEYAPRGYALAVTGPWPPYRFGGLEPGAARDQEG
jgi:hypothetical protein